MKSSRTEGKGTRNSWKKINTAKELLNDIHTHDLAKQAVHMLDWCEGHASYEITPGVREDISYNDVISAFRSAKLGRRA